MALLASIFAYFGSVAAIVLAVAMSYDALIYGPSLPMVPPQALTLAATPSAGKEAAKLAISVVRDDRLGARSAPPEATGAVSAAAAGAKPAPARIASVQGRAGRRPALQNRSREWFAGQWPQTAGYADEPRPLFDDASR